MTDLEMSDLWQFKDSLPDGEIKELLNNALFDLSLYQRCGTPQDCENRLEWLSYSIEDIRNHYNALAKEMHDYVETIINPPKKRRGRPPKSKDGE